jgi:predicted DNA-binding transcriptional regulator AlpA
MALQDGEISVKQAAQILGIPADAIYNWLRHGQVPARTRAGRWCIPWGRRNAGDLPAEGSQVRSASSRDRPANAARAIR